MESMSAEQVKKWLAETTGSDEAALRSATAALESVQTIPGFASCLLAIIAEDDGGQKLAAATYLKNFLRSHWSQSDLLTSHERSQVRIQLVQLLLHVEFPVFKVLAEALRLVVVNDFAEENAWPELVPGMKTSIQHSNLMAGAESSQIKTLNALLALKTIIKPFQYFRNPKVAHEPVPEQLELISLDLLVPLHGLFHLLIEQAIISRDKSAVDNDNILLVLCKCFHLAIWSHMPISLVAHLGNWIRDLLVFLGTVILEERLTAPEHIHRMKAWKRTLMICRTLVTRHRRYVDKFLPDMSAVVLKIAGRSACLTECHPLQEHVISLTFDVISSILETGPGWRLMASRFSSLLDSVIFPALRLKEKDIFEWINDEEEYLQKNLPADLDEASGWRDDLFTPRRSALNLLGVISISKGPPTAAVTRKPSELKRKKTEKSRKGSGQHGTAGELLVVPFLSRFPAPPDAAAALSQSVIDYYGVLLAYGGLLEFLKRQRPEYIGKLLQVRVLPLYALSSPSPFILANANWLLGELASYLPEEMKNDVYNSLIKALLAPNTGDISWRPVRASAAGAISALLQEDYKPSEWLPLLQATINGAKAIEDDEASLSLKLLAAAAETDEESLLPYIPAILSTVKEEIQRRIRPIPEPWPQVVESGFYAMATLVQAWASSQPDEEEGGEASEKWMADSVALASTCSELLQHAWLPKNGAITELLPPPSCLNNASVLLATVMKHATEADMVARWKVEELLQVWSDLVADWSAWEEAEDLAVFEAIQEAISLHGKFPLSQFAVTPIPPPPHLPVQPRSILQGITAFCCSAIETAYAAATWRSCRLSHSLLHVSAVSFESEQVTPILVAQFSQAAFLRLWKLSNTRVPLAKPLVLILAACFICSPDSFMSALSEEAKSRKDMDINQTLLQWGEALAELAHSTAEPGLLMESELKLAVIALLKLSEVLLCSDAFQHQSTFELISKGLQSVLDASIRLKAMQDSIDSDENVEDTDTEGGDGESDDDSGEEDDDDDDEDDSHDDSDEEKYDETEEQFLQRYAETAKELEKEVVEEAEGGEEEDGEELDIGVLGLTDPKALLFSFLQKHGHRLLIKNQFQQELISKFLESFPDFSHLIR